jgi:hypothetical protein
MRYFTGFLIILSSVIFWMLPVSDSIYTWKTEPRTDTFNVDTAVGITTASSTLIKPIYDNDTATLDLISDLSTDVPLFVSYNGTTQSVSYSGLTDNATREMSITYDISAFDESTVFETLSDMVVWLIFIFFIVFPLGGLWVAFKPDIIRVFS